jgi:carboxylate-amine ligase
MTHGARPAWATWCCDAGRPAFTVGVEEEVMLLEPNGFALAQAIHEVLNDMPDALGEHITSETHSAAVELGTGVHRHVGAAVDQLGRLRLRLSERLDALGLTAAVAGTHPFAVWQEMQVTDLARHQLVFGSMRALAQREPTFALHVHVGIPDPEDAIRAANAMRAHLPVLLALSANSPFWQGRDTGLASARTPLFQAFPRVGIPRVFADYDDYVQTVDLLIRCRAFPEPTFLWWDVRPQPRFGTIEVRIMDAQSTLTATRALVALTQCLVRLEVCEGYAAQELVRAPEALEENRFIAARDGIGADLVDPLRGERVALHVIVDELLAACAPHAAALGCEAELALVPVLFDDPSAGRHRRIAEQELGLPGLVDALAADFVRSPVAL